MRILLHVLGRTLGSARAPAARIFVAFIVASFVCLAQGSVADDGRSAASRQEGQEASFSGTVQSQARHERVLSEAELKALVEHPFFALDYSLFEPPLLNKPCAHVTALVQTYNEALFLEESIASAAYTLGEVLVVDHGSTDHTAEIIRRVQKVFSNVRYHYADRHEISYGMAKQLTLNMTRTEWALRWDADFIAHNRTIMTNMCTNLATNTSGLDIFAFPIPRVDGDLYHVGARFYRGSGPESYLFRRNAVRFGLAYGYDDFTIPLPGMRLGGHPTVLPGSLGNTFMLHLATFKPIHNIVRRGRQTEYNVYVRAVIERGERPTDYWTWLEMASRGVNAVNATPSDYGTRAQIVAYREGRTRYACLLNKPLAYYDIRRWPHTNFVNRLLERKMMLFFVVPPSGPVAEQPTHPEAGEMRNCIVFHPGCPLVGEFTKSRNYLALAMLIDRLST